jgi:hypothetical protein
MLQTCIPVRIVNIHKFVPHRKKIPTEFLGFPESGDRILVRVHE